MGVLIVGSLYWDPLPKRIGWRRSRLDMNEQFKIRVPIRYGRRSQSRSNTYTMVFSSDCLRRCLLRNRLGQAKAIRCRGPITSIQDLVIEAQRLWDAESKNRQAGVRLSPEASGENWGCVALLVNPNSDVPQNLLDAWSDRVATEPNYADFGHAAQEEAVIGNNGLLRIPWPKLSNGKRQLPLDLLLATPTNPHLEGDPPSYPTPATIAQAWNEAPQHFDYFTNNLSNEIRTCQDRAIMKYLSTQLRDAARRAT